MTIGLSMTVRYCGHHCTQLCLGVFSPVGRDGRPPTLIRDGSEKRREEPECTLCGFLLAHNTIYWH